MDKMQPDSKRAAARQLAEELQTDIELSRLSAVDVARRAYRLARMVDDFDALAWLKFEVQGWPRGNTPLPVDAWAAAVRSGRTYTDSDGKSRASTASLSELAASVQGALAQVAAARDPDVSLSSSNPHQHVFAPPGNRKERGAVRKLAAEQSAIIDRVLGAIHEYVSGVFIELRFGAAVEHAFEVVRNDVDNAINSLVPEATLKLSSAFENVTSDNPEDWASAAATCRRLVKACADALRPPGEPVDGRPMTDQHYVNRLVDWIARQTESDTERGMIVGELDFLCKKLDAVDSAGQKGAHAEVSKFEAARYVTGTYLTLGDLLRLRKVDEAEGDVVGVVSEHDEQLDVASKGAAPPAA